MIEIAGETTANLAALPPAERERPDFGLRSSRTSPANCCLARQRPRYGTSRAPGPESGPHRDRKDLPPVAPACCDPSRRRPCRGTSGLAPSALAPTSTRPCRR